MGKSDARAIAKNLGSGRQRRGEFFAAVRVVAHVPTPDSFANRSAPFRRDLRWPPDFLTRARGLRLNRKEGVMKTYFGAETVKGGYYLNVGEWKLEAVDGNAGTLPGGAEARYVRVPMPGLLVVAPVLGMALVVVLPFFGLAVLGEGLWTKARTMLAVRRVRATTVRR
jgi:hypothetical protein